MATRAIKDLQFSLVKNYKVKSGTTLVVGSRVKFGTADDEVDLGGANDDTTWGTVDAFSNTSTSTPRRVNVVLDGHQIVPMLVGTGGTTRGVKQVQAANGITDAPANGGGTTAHTSVGIAMQTGVVGDVVGVLTINQRFVAAT